MADSAAQRLLLDREAELFDDLPDEELRAVFDTDDFADFDREPLPPDDRFALDLPALADREDPEFAPPLLADLAPPLFLDDELDEVRFEDELDEPLFAEDDCEDLLPADRDALTFEPLVRLPFDPEEELLPAERDFRLPLDLRADEDARFADELRDDDLPLRP